MNNSLMMAYWLENSKKEDFSAEEKNVSLETDQFSEQRSGRMKKNKWRRRRFNSPF
jgi:phosphoketolase